MMKAPEQFRITEGKVGRLQQEGPNGFFLLKGPNGATLKTVASNKGGWEHVSVSAHGRCPTWEEMALVKSHFWDDTDLVIQYMVPASDHLNFHPYVLHMWRKHGTNDFCEMPPSIMVGPKNDAELQSALGAVDIQILCIGPIVPGQRLPQLITSAHPDLSREQWQALGAGLIELAETANIVDAGGLHDGP